jgi:hypothetical protein
MKIRLVLALALAFAFLPTRAHAQMPATAFDVDARFSAGFVFTGNAFESTILSMPSLTIGARLIDRLQVGLGIGLVRFARPNGGVGVPANGTSADTAFVLAPTIAVDILKAKDNRVAWYGKASLPLGVDVISDAAGNTTNLIVVGYDLGLGVRYCPHPNFAAGLEAGLAGIFFDPNGNRGFGFTSFYGALVGTFYWGKGS